MLLGELDHSVSQLKGIGPQSASQLAGLGIISVADLLLHRPRDYEDRSTTVPLRDWTKAPVNTVVEVVAHDFFGHRRGRTLKVYVQDETGTATLLCFNRNFLQNVLKVGEKFRLYGNFTYRYGELQSSSFETEKLFEQSSSFGRILPIYPLTGKLNQGLMRRAVRDALRRYGRYVDSELPESLRRHFGYLPKSEAIRQVHFPDSFEQLDLALQGLSFEELLYFQIVVARRAYRRDESRRAPQLLPYRLQRRCIEALPFKLTADQKQVIEEIKKDLDGPHPMGRLLQGDVGSGKTLTALLSALPVIEAGYQVAFLAPTELLAKQHAERAAGFLEQLGVRLAFLSGHVKNAVRAPLLTALAEGRVDLIIGTHALFTEDVRFQNLRYVIIDEQHKFGVEQRGRLIEKGRNPDLLLMTATPIPRTLTLTFFGDLQVSSIRSMPPGRKPVVTHLARQDNEEKVYRAVRKELERGHQAYFVYPRISGDGESDLKDAETMALRLRETIFSDFSLALIHSKRPEEEKERIMHDFAQGKIQVLVSTSVVEVGVDVANATCMVVEQAERFGLAALHQLRGRVGRSSLQSYVFLVYSRELSEEGKRRLMVMKRSSDGFEISEEDLKLRGPGELGGTRQSGSLGLRFTDLNDDLELLQRARKEAFRIVKADPALALSQHQNLSRVLECCAPFPEELFAGG
ncbi:MAG TPA: ATP-dependent DNA helicase RecG [Sediminispirochaeta sp.]|nr:ATP-dependent DNA helicase RecG [Sediminispirochaeta sp.]